jgi:pilus assembly protein CpaB
MRAKSMVLILIALGCGLVASIAISQVMERGGNSDNDALETVQIYVASTDIDVNDQLDAENVRVEDWPKSKVPEGAIMDLEKITEQFARVRFYEGEPILQAKLANGIDGPAIKIPEGFRVCSLKVQMDTAVSGLVNPGDRVDIYGYFRKGPEVPRTGTRQILRNVRVFAVNSETEQETDQEGRTIIAKTVSMLVEQDQVAKLMLATELGTLRLALRRPNETGKALGGGSATPEELFSSRPENADPEEKEPESSAPKQPQGDSKLASAAGSFAQFLAGLNKSNQQSAAQGFQVAATQPAVPAWKMEVLTPDGGKQFTWNDEDRLPSQGSTTGPQPARNATSMPANMPRGMTAPQPSAAPPTPAAPQGDQPVPEQPQPEEEEDGSAQEEEQEQEPAEEEDNQPVIDD